MNKKDIILILIIILISFLLIMNKNKKQANIAYVYYDNDLILQIDLSKDNTYKVNGNNGEVVIEVKENKIRVNEENSPYHLCSKQGYISKQGESIVCLPNKIIIKLPNNDIDTEVG